MPIKEAIELAIRSLENEAELYKCDERGVEILGQLAGPGALKNVRRRRELLEAASELKAFRYQDSCCSNVYVSR